MHKPRAIEDQATADNIVAGKGSRGGTHSVNAPAACSAWDGCGANMEALRETAHASLQAQSQSPTKPRTDRAHMCGLAQCSRCMCAACAHHGHAQSGRGLWHAPPHTPDLQGTTLNRCRPDDTHKPQGCGDVNSHAAIHRAQTAEPRKIAQTADSKNHTAASFLTWASHPSQYADSLPRTG